MLDVDLVDPLTFVVGQHTPKRHSTPSSPRPHRGAPRGRHRRRADKLKSTTITAKNNAADQRGRRHLHDLRRPHHHRHVRPRPGAGQLHAGAPRQQGGGIHVDEMARRRRHAARRRHRRHHDRARVPLHLDAAVDRLPHDVSSPSGRSASDGRRITADVTDPRESITLLEVGVGKAGAPIPFLRNAAYVSATDDGHGATGIAAAGPRHHTRRGRHRRPCRRRRHPADRAAVRRPADGADAQSSALVADLPTLAHVSLDTPDPDAAVKTTVDPLRRQRHRRGGRRHVPPRVQGRRRLRRNVRSRPAADRRRRDADRRRGSPTSSPPTTPARRRSSDLCTSMAP